MGLDSVELVMAVEEAFAFDIPDRDVRHLETVGQLRDYVVRRTGRSPSAVWPILVGILERDFAVKPEHIGLDTRIVADLGID
jgi:hypothetical protein